MKYQVHVVRKQSWGFEVEANSLDEAKLIADEMALVEPAHDDWAYETVAVEVKS